MSFDNDDDKEDGGFGGTSAAAAVAPEEFVAASTGGAGGFCGSLASAVTAAAAAGSLLLSLLRAVVVDDDEGGNSRALEPGRRLRGGGALRAGDGAARPTDAFEEAVEDEAVVLLSVGAFSLARGLAGIMGLRRGLDSLGAPSPASPGAASAVPASSFLEAPFWLLLLALLLLCAGSLLFALDAPPLEVVAAVVLLRSRLESALLPGDACGKKRPLLDPLLLLLLFGRMEGAAAIRPGGSDRGADADPSLEVGPLPARSPPRGVSPLLDPLPPPPPFTGSRPKAAGGLAFGLES